MAKIPFGKKVQQIRTLGALWKHRSGFFSMFREIWKGTYKATFLTIIALIIGIIYIVSPIDLIPDFIPVIGWIDDGAVMYLLLKRLMKELSRYEASRQHLNIIRIK